MRLLYSPDSWVYSFGFTPMVDFCFWALEVDGLQVPPFDRHPAGDGSLQTAGLDARTWQSWLVRVVTLQEAQQQAWQQSPHRAAPPSPEEFRKALIPEAHDPSRAWQGGARVGQRLGELWKQYGPLTEGRKEAEPHLTRLIQREDRDRGQRLYDALRPYRARIPTLIVHLATYPAAINYLIPPVAVVLTVPPEATRNAPRLRERILDAAAGLSALAKGTCRAPNYTAEADGTPGQPALAYRVFAFSPPVAPTAPPTSPALPPRRPVPARDAVQQAALDELNRWGRTGEMVGLGTVRFLRTKAIPGWQLLEVTYDDDEGTEQRRTMIFRRDEYARWRLAGAHTSSDVRALATEWLVPIHDHPLIFVSGSKGGHADGSQQFVAHGEVHDNGFEVLRVRLTNDAGQTLEDVVENGLVLFVALQQEEVQWPMRAELYDRAGKLVWRETVLDNRPPGWMRFRR